FRPVQKVVSPEPLTCWGTCRNGTRRTSNGRNEAARKAFPVLAATFRKEVPMKRGFLALAAFAMLTAGAVTTANAIEFGVGPNGAYVGPDRGYYRDYGRDCRTIIVHRTNQYGEDVEIRKRICD